MDRQISGLTSADTGSNTECNTAAVLGEYQPPLLCILLHLLLSASPLQHIAFMPLGQGIRTPSQSQIVSLSKGDVRFSTWGLTMLHSFNLQNRQRPFHSCATVACPACQACT